MKTYCVRGAGDAVADLPKATDPRLVTVSFLRRLSERIEALSARSSDRKERSSSSH